MGCARCTPTAVSHNSGKPGSERLGPAGASKVSGTVLSDHQGSSSASPSFADTGGGDEPALRTELFSVSQLEQHARLLAARHDVGRARGTDRLIQRLDANELTLQKAYALLAEAVRDGRHITPAAEWYLDNYHLIEEQVRTARRHLPPGFSSELPRLTSAPSAGSPRVYDLAFELMSHSHGWLDLEGLRAFVTAYQSVRPLRLGELWATPIMLRLALLENLRRLMARVVIDQQERAAAAGWVERMLQVAESAPARVVLVLAQMVEENPPLTNAFVAELAGRLQGFGPGLVFPISWLEQRLAEKGQTVEQVLQLVGQTQAANQVYIGNTIGSLRLLGATDWGDFVEAMSVVEHRLLQDPAGVYGTMTFATRDAYRHVVEALAKRSPLEEEEVAGAAIELARAGSARQSHVGYFLVDRGLAELKSKARTRRTVAQRLLLVARRRPFIVYAGAIAAITIGATWGLARLVHARGYWGWELALAVALIALAVSHLATVIVQWAATLIARPSVLPRLDFSAGIPASHRTVVAVPTLLTDAATVDSLLESLEVRFLANRDPHLSFVLLSDFVDAPTQQTPEDDALLHRAREGILALNARYVPAGGGPCFYLFHRPRRWSPRQGVWMGWERKRGKLEQFNDALRGSPGDFDVTPADGASLGAARYVIVLDSDTQLPRDAARKLAGTLAHPLNRPRVDERLGRVVEGYGILQPRVAITMASSGRSGFARVFSGEPGIDPYTLAVSDVYQDLFGEGSFVGKGIYDIDAVRRVLGGRLPEDRILSHDLLEGGYARSGLVSDVLLVEDFPPTYFADVQRRHRWMRGDWQLLGWLGRRVPAAAGDGQTRNPLSLLSQWKILDNLRRSVLPIALVALLGAGWFVPGMAAPATFVVLGLLVTPGLLAAGAALTRRSGDVPRGVATGDVLSNLGRQLKREAFALSCLPYEAQISAGAIVRTVWRILTGRRLLEWRTASAAQHGGSPGFVKTYGRMAIAPLAACGVFAGLWFAERPALLVATPILFCWAVAPAVVWVLSRARADDLPALAQGDVLFLRRLARLTWRFFETFVTSDDRYLPPDNFQHDPPQGIAHRTSPTNIALSLTANLAAYDFGYIPAGELLERTRLTMGTMDRLERYRGHFYNWYDTRTLAPLRPMYVSTVDSGNLAGHLLTLAVGLRGMGRAPIVHARVFEGLRDTLAVLETKVDGDAHLRTNLARLMPPLDGAPTTLSSARTALEELRASVRGLELSVNALRHPDLSVWASALEAQVSRALDELRHWAPWEELLSAPVSASAAVSADLREALSRLDLVQTFEETAALECTAVPAIDSARARASAEDGPWLTLLRDAVHLGAGRAASLVGEATELATRATELADLDYEFLYDRTRCLLAIGYNVADHRLDVSFYDLLASEARLASFVGIAQGKLPQEHWFSLGRALTASRGKPALLSWSGSMFEYLMPLLVMPTYRATILDETYRGVIERQVEYGRERGVPWGVSESGYNKTDAQLNYQYRAFGVPGLGFKRGLAEDLVIAPYASAMALMVAPQAACDNLRRLELEGRLGNHGFYEAIDYTPSRLPRGKDAALVASFMAHHQGMAFLSFAYLLLDRPMQRRFEAEPAFRAIDLLLQERVPQASPIYPHPAEVSAAAEPRSAAPQNLRVFTTPNTASPQVQSLSNGAYHVMITNAGGGYSRWRDLAVTRWREDRVLDNWGTFGYLRDVESGRFWSMAHQPTLVRASSYEAIFTQGRAEFRRSDQGIDTHVEICVSPEDDVELRRVTLTNRGRNARIIELTTFAEVVLATPAADVAHPAFSNLFVQTEWVEERNALLCTRRPRSGSEKPPWMLHLVTVQGELDRPPSYETARGDFIGRGRSPADPRAMRERVLGNTVGSVLDPAVAIRNTVRIAPEETVRLHLVTGMAQTREAALTLADKYGDRHSAERVLELSWTHSQVLLRRLDATEADTQLYERLASHVLYGGAHMRAAPSLIARNEGGQAALWAYAISGDLPIMLVRVADRQQLNLVRQMVRAHAYFRLKGLAVDLVVWNEDPSGYRQVLHEEIVSAIATLSESALMDRPGGLFVRRSDQITEVDKVLLLTVARLVVVGTDGTLAEQLNRRPPQLVKVPRFAGSAYPVADPRATDRARVERTDLIGWNGLGGFTADGREYVITTTRGQRTPAPWVNVLANPYFGTVVSESGGAYTWCENARNYRLTPWHNDPVSDPSGEAIYVRDEQGGQFWSPTPLPAGGAEPYTTRHGFGYSAFEHQEDGIESELLTFVATDAPIKFLRLRLKNLSGRTRRLSVTSVFELVLGENRANSLPYVVTEVDPGSGAILARNAYTTEFAKRVAFLDCSEGRRSVSGDRGELLGRNGSFATPACMSSSHLSGRVGAALDPCLAMQVMVDLPEGHERDIVFTFGSGMDLSDARSLIHRFRGVTAAHGAIEGVWSYWKRTLGAAHVQTPDAAFNVLVNGWLLYQVLSARMWGRSGFYQSGGAFGFRDQLQDAMALVHAEPAILREQIVRCASRQFREGDVQHWWHPPLGRGVRTRISDDYLWLPYAVCRYIDALGDTGVLDERVPFIESRAVKPDEDSYYDMPIYSEESGTVYEHCVRAIRNGLRFGEHGLPLMGSGDWNDGMNLVGDEGRGESVWLAFFLYDVLVRFADVARSRQDDVFADGCRADAVRLQAAIEEHGWDGEWYRRAYFDSGDPLGSSANLECQIDSLPQSWAMLTGAGDPERARLALEAVDARLVKRQHRLIQLFDPAFDKSQNNPGYIMGYVPGVRENGAQYTHAAVWAVMAFAAAGDVERAWELFGLINPVHHGDSAAAVARYKVEPYAVAADVYTNAQHAGRGGWSWYTGSAAWMYRLAIESLLGLRLEVDRLWVEPLLPAGWERFDVHYRFRRTTYHIHVQGPAAGGRGAERVVCDGGERTERSIALYDDGGEHHVEVWVRGLGE